MEVPGKSRNKDVEEVDAVLCQPCQERNQSTRSNGFCAQCREHMCVNCFDTHKQFKVSRGHSLVDGNDASVTVEQNEVLQKCDQHFSELVKFYCPVHEQVGCGDCMILEHKVCKVEYIRDKAREFADSLEFKGLVNDADKCLSQCKETATSIKNNKVQVSDISEKFIKDVEMFSESLISQINKMKTSMIKQANMVKSKDLETLEELEKENEVLMEDISSLAELLKSQTEQPSKLFVSCVIKKPRLKQLIESHLKMEKQNSLQNYQFIRNGNLEQAVKETRGLGSLEEIKLENDETDSRWMKELTERPTAPTGGGFAVASELKQGSVMDILGGGSLKKSATPSTQSVGPRAGSPGTETSKAPPLSTLFKQSGWNCDVCLINNKDDVNKCVACQTPKPSGQKSEDMTNTTSTTSEPAKTDLFAKFQAPSGTWPCDVCLLLNKSDASKCVACQSQKPASKASSTSEPAKTDVFAKFQKPSGTWSCDVCLIQNKSELTKCAACQSLKPGEASSGSFPLIGSIQPGNWICSKCLIQNKQSDTICGACKAAKSSSKRSETEKSDSLFEKLKPATGAWECKTCLVQNMKDAKTCVACQTPKPLKFFKRPPGDWTCDTCLVSNNENAVNCVACNYARPGPPRTQAGPTAPTGGGIAVASELKQGSVMDILGGGSLKKSATPSAQPVGPLAGSPGTETSKVPPLSTLFKQSGWNCDVCLINNKDNIEHFFKNSA